MLTVITPENLSEHAQTLTTVITKTEGGKSKAPLPIIDGVDSAACIVHFEPSSGLFGKLLLRPFDAPHISDDTFTHFGLVRRPNIFIVEELSYVINPLTPFLDTDQERDFLMRKLYQNFYQGLLRFALPRLVDFMIIRSSAEKFEDLGFLGCWPFKSSLKPLRVADPQTGKITVYSLVPVDEAAFLDFKIRIEGLVFSAHTEKTPISSYC
jgi:hypothetical protein